MFSPAKLGILRVKNRLFMSAAASWRSTEQGDIDYSVPLLHFEIAKGGCGMIINGGVGGVHPSGRRAHNSPLFDTDDRIASHKRFADTVHQGGSAVAFQATHSGFGAAKYQLSIGKTPFVPSFIYKGPGEYAPTGDYPAQENQILEVISAYGDSALRARKAGYDAIEVHAAHESLLAQWLSPVTNTRKDGWGGSAENRCRLHRAIARDIKTKAGKDFPVIFKLGMQDGFPGGLPLQDGLAAAEALAGTGDVDALEVSQGLSGPMSDFNNTSMKPGITSVEKEAYYRDWARRVKALAKGRCQVILQGGLRTPALLDEILETGDADFVSMCRPYIREPKLPARWASGDTARATCISCNKCVLAHAFEGKPLACQLDQRKG